MAWGACSWPRIVGRPRRANQSRAAGRRRRARLVTSGICQAAPQQPQTMHSAGASHRPCRARAGSYLAGIPGRPRAQDPAAREDQRQAAARALVQARPWREDSTGRRTPSGLCLWLLLYCGRRRILRNRQDLERRGGLLCRRCSQVIVNSEFVRALYLRQSLVMLDCPCCSVALAHTSGGFILLPPVRKEKNIVSVVEHFGLHRWVWHTIISALPRPYRAGSGMQ